MLRNPVKYGSASNGFYLRFKLTKDEVVALGEPQWVVDVSHSADKPVGCWLRGLGHLGIAKSPGWK